MTKISNGRTVLQQGRDRLAEISSSECTHSVLSTALLGLEPEAVAPLPALDKRLGNLETWHPFSAAAALWSSDSR